MSQQPVALVTGGSRGIGRGICQALGAEKYAVLINYNSNIAAAEETRELVEKAGGNAEICQADVSITEDRALLLEFCLEHYGRLDLLVNNAGIAPSQRMDLLETTEESYDRVLSTNLKSAFFMSQAAARIMLRQIKAATASGGMIINVSSISAYTASISRGEYCVSKAGLSMVTALFADRLANEGIRVYEIRPGIVETDMTHVVHDKYEKLIRDGLSPIRRWGKPEDIGKAVAMLARGNLPFSTGEVINVDGGFHLRRL